MLIKASTADFKESVNTLLQGEKKAAVNFRLRGDTLLLQVNKGIVIEKGVKAAGEGQQEIDITVALDGAINLLNDDIPVVDLTFDQGMLRITQEFFQYDALRLLEQAVDFPEVFTWQKLGMEDFRSIASASVYLEEIGRTLGETSAAVSIHKGMVYIIYSNTAFICRTALPNMCMTAESVKGLRKALTGGTPVYNFVEERGLFIVKQGDAKILVTALRENVEAVYNVLRVCDRNRQMFLGEYDLTRYAEAIHFISSAYKKVLLDLSVCRGDIGIFVESPSAHFVVGGVKDIQCNIRLNTAQLACIGKLFGQCRQVGIWKGDNCLCLENKQWGKTLVLAGMIC